MPNPTIFRDDLAIAAREPEVPNANFHDGANNAASNACGIGINLDQGDVVGTPEQFTLLDQEERQRAGQRSQSIGGYPYNEVANLPASGGTEGTLPAATIFGAVVSDNGDGTVVSQGNATMIDLASGWVAVP